MRAIIGGAGRLPEILAGRAGPGTLLCRPEGVAFGAGRRDVPAFRVERLGELIAMLRANGVDEVCLAGAMRRPALDLAALDPFTAALAPRLVPALRDGDDATLRFVLNLFEEHGFAILAAHEVAPDLLPPPGVPTRASPNDVDRTDAARAARVSEALGAADVGQTCVVAQGLVLAVEALPGTDWMLRTLVEGDAEWRPDPARGRGVFFKAPKPTQDLRVDLPAVGPETVAGIASAGLAGAVVEAGGVLILDREAVVAAADAAGLFLWIRERGAPCAPS